MFEDLIVQLDEMGVSYTEDYDAGTLVIDIADVDKMVLVEIIQLLTSYTFDLTESTITVQGDAVPAEEETVDEEAYLNDALAQM